MADDTQPLCPTCQSPQQGVVALSEPAKNKVGPNPGDFSLCFACGAIGVFTGEGLTTRVATEEETQRALKNPEMARLTQEIKMQKSFSDW